MQYPLGVRRDGSYYTRIEWASHTETDPTFWVVNLIRDDTERNGGTWGAHTEGGANVVLSFFGEEQTVSKVRIFRNVGLDISILDELAKTIDIYYSDTDEPLKLRRAEDDIEAIDWKFVMRVPMEKAEGWQEIDLPAPIQAKYMRFVLVDNHNDETTRETARGWTETSEIKIYP